MKELEELLAAFDAEFAHLSTSRTAATQRFLRGTASRQRVALERYCTAHGRLPATVGELVASGIGVPRFHDLVDEAEHGRIAGEMSMRAFLRQTQADVDHIGHNGIEATWNALRLVHAVYRAHDPGSGWRTAARDLAARGFTAEQIDLARSDPDVRKALRKLLRPFHG